MQGAEMTKASVALLDLLMVVVGALLGVGVGGDPGEGGGEPVAERVGRPAQLAGHLWSRRSCARRLRCTVAWPRSVSTFITLGYRFAGKMQKTMAPTGGRTE